MVWASIDTVMSETLIIPIALIKALSSLRLMSLPGWFESKFESPRTEIASVGTVIAVEAINSLEIMRSTNLESRLYKSSN